MKRAGGVLILSTTLAIALTLACDAPLPGHGTMQLSSGGTFRLLLHESIALKTGEPAEMIRFEAKAPFDDREALRREALAIASGWAEIKSDTDALVLSVFSPERAGWDRRRENHQFLARRETGGGWAIVSDLPGQEHEEGGFQRVIASFGDVPEGGAGG